MFLVVSEFPEFKKFISQYDNGISCNEADPEKIKNAILKGMKFKEKGNKIDQQRIINENNFDIEAKKLERLYTKICN